MRNVEQITLLLQANAFEGIREQVDAMQKDRWQVVASYANAYRDFFVDGKPYGSHATEVVVFFKRECVPESVEERRLGPSWPDTPVAATTQEGGPYPKVVRSVALPLLPTHDEQGPLPARGYRSWGS